MKKNILLCCVCFLVFLSCKNEVPIEEPPSVIPEENVNNEEKNKTYLEIKNQSQFDVNIYFTAPSEDSLWLKVPTGKTVKKEISPSQTEAGDSVYIEYEYVVGNIVIPYYNPKSNDCIKILPIYENEINTINLSKISSFSSDSTYLIIQNESSDAVFLSESRSSIVYPYLSKDQWIKPNQDVIYDITGNLNINNYYIGNGLSDVKLDINNIVAGNIYVLRYSSESISLLSIVPLDLSIQDKIWKVSLSQDVGKTLLAGHFTSRKNPSDGYMLFGRQVYSNDEELINNSVPYYAFIDSKGNILEENTILFKDNLLDAQVRRVIDSGEYVLACGEKVSSDNITSAFVMGMNGLSVYDDILVGDKNVVASVQTMIQNGNDSFCVLAYKDKYSEDEEYLCSTVSLIKLSVDSYFSVSSELLWESEEEVDLWAYDVIYDEFSNTFVVLTWNDDKGYTKLFFIDGTSGTETFDSVILEMYELQTTVKNSDGKVFLCGAFINQITNAREACFMELNVSTGTIVNNNPTTFPSKNKKLSSYFNDIIFKDNYVILGGSTDYLNAGELDDCIPYFVAYDISKNKIIWEQRFDDLEGYVVYSCNASNLSFIYELYNYNTLHSYVVSAGLLGEIPSETKLTLPYSSTISEVETPDVSVYFYENATSEEDSHYKEAIFKYGDEITLDDLEKYPPTSFSDGYEILGWYEWGCEAEEEIVFPYKLNSLLLNIYPKIALSAPKNLSGFALSNSEIYLEWNANPAATNYDIYINDTLFATTSSTKYTVIGLNPKTTYKVYVVASNGNDRSKSSDLIQVTTTTYYRGDINQVPSSAFRMRNNIWYYNTLQDVDVHYYFMFLDAGNTYEIVWCDSNDGSEVLAEEGLYPYADVVVNMYLAGETNSSKFNCFEINSGYTDPYQITPSESGYYVVEVVGNSKSRGYYLVGYVQIDSINQYGLLLSGDIAGDISDAGLPLVYEGEGIYTLTFTYENNMKQWGSPLGTCQFKIRTVAGSWEDVSYGLSSKHPVINGGEVPCIEVPDSNFIVDGFIVGTTYKITVRCTSTGEVFVKINTV